MNELLEKIKERIEPVLDKLNVYLVDLTLSRVKHANKYIFFIDKDTYVTVDDCSMVSRKIEKILIEENFISPSDQIEVSSPGVDRPLKFLRQYPKHKEKFFSVTFRKFDQTITKELILKDVIDEKLIFDDRGNLLEINFSDIVKAKTLVKFK
jgi:ribosome maturation factor RimP